MTLSAECEPLVTAAECVECANRVIFFKLITISSLLRLILFFGRDITIEPTNNEFSLGTRIWLRICSLCNRFLIQDCIDEKLLRVKDFSCLSRNSHAPSFKIKIDPRLIAAGLYKCKSHGNFWKDKPQKLRGDIQIKDKVGQWKVTLGDGTIRLYKKRVQIDPRALVQFEFPSLALYLLTEEIKPNGNRLVFDYEVRRANLC